MLLSGTLVELTLNDRCDFGSGHPDNVVDPKTIVAELAETGLFATVVTCRDGTTARGHRPAR